MKICMVCGNTVPDTTKECPNCGSYDFRTMESKNIDPRFKKDIDPRFKKWK